MVNRVFCYSKDIAKKNGNRLPFLELVLLTIIFIVIIIASVILFETMILLVISMIIFMVLVVAINCLFILDSVTISPSINVIVPTPARIKASATKEPTPPIPKIAT